MFLIPNRKLPDGHKQQKSEVRCDILYLQNEVRRHNEKPSGTNLLSLEVRMVVILETVITGLGDEGDSEDGEYILFLVVDADYSGVLAL